MEWLKNKSLKQAFFTITSLYLLAGLLLSIVSFSVCLQMRSLYDSQSQIQISMGENGRILSEKSDIQGTDTPEILTPKEGGSSGISSAVFSLLQFILPVFFVVLSLILADITFYRWKLKKPLEILAQSAARIQNHDLDFQVDTSGNDELGQLCSAFETMRAGLLEANKALWRQVEERKRLNAAFAHDLRNPVTVLKGSARLLRSQLEKEDHTEENAGDTLDLISQYAGRIELYVSAMTSAQKLEDLTCRPFPLTWSELKNSLHSSLTMLASVPHIRLDFQSTDIECELKADQSILFNVAENLVSNALRYANTTVSVSLALGNEKITLSVLDDGPGFSQAILQKGAAPFLRDTDADSEHFGMGLYVCRLLCEKHGGALHLTNSATGAAATAEFHVVILD